MRVPAIIESAVMQAREADRERHRMLKERQAEKNRENERLGLPYEYMGLYTPPPETFDQESQFWLIQDDDELLDVCDELCGALERLDEDSLAELPSGYRPLAAVLNFELHRQGDGWQALLDREPYEIQKVIEGYRVFGLLDEAKAIEAALSESLKLPFDETADWYSQAYDRISDAYRSVNSSTPEIDDRLLALVNFVRSNPQLFSGE